MHVNYSSRIVLIRPGTVTPLRRSGLRVHVRWGGPGSRGVTRTRPGGAARTRHPSSSSGSARRAPTLVIVGQTSARFTSPSPPWRLMEDVLAVLSARAPAMFLAACSIAQLLLKDHTTERFPFAHLPSLEDCL